MQATHGAGHPTIVLSGFFGRGNCGDEAILQAQYELLEPRFTVVISVDERGAYDGFWNWYPYDRCRIVHQANLGVLAEPEVVGIHVGGGGLPHGFNAAQVVHARSLDKPAFLTGVDAHPPRSSAAAGAMGSYLGLFDQISVRSAAAWSTMSSLAPGCHQGTDWAVGLPTDGPAFGTRSDDVLVTIREFPEEFVTARYVDALAELIAILAGSHERVVALPFCPEDERFLDRLAPAASLPREVHWWNPRGMQRCIAAARRVVSVGRLHPLVFAANVGTPAAFVEPLAHEPRWAGCTKARQLSAEHAWPYYRSIREAIEDFAARGCPWTPSGFAEDTHGRRRAMAERLTDGFAAAGAGRPGGRARAG
ncbi:MAG: polysaccharide pyruvyl transferase family protein [Planctomycetaceae bacterium]